MHLPVVLPLTWICLGTSLLAQLSPGELHDSHSHLEGMSNCTQCHESGKQLSSQKCLTCHTLLASQIASGKGAHANQEFRQCENCHIEHQGKNFDLIHWEGGKEVFDHRLSGYSLEGAHTRLKCEECHREEYIRDKVSLTTKDKNLKRTFLGLSQDCLTCHKDHHRQQLAEACLSCHSFDAWIPATRFNHKNTAFPLSGRHRLLSCDQCHSKQKDQQEDFYIQYKKLPHGRCSDCHRDIHAGRLGDRCADCHTTAGWRGNLANVFNHDHTKYPLRGKHKRVACTACHPTGRSLKIARFTFCRDCHSDYHQGQFSARERKGACEECHTVTAFSPSSFTLEAHQETDYPLTGAHFAIPCTACHQKTATGIKFRLLSYDCITCHSDPHEGHVDKFLDKISGYTKKSGCQYCHSTESWSTVAFDHTSTGFALEYKHKDIRCISCHKRSIINKTVFKGLKPACYSCHEDIHYGQFEVVNNPDKTECERCHQSDNWHHLIFNHIKDSKFPLRGKHAQIDCRACHKSDSKNGRIFIHYKPMETDCKSCHGNKSATDSSYINSQQE
jgi:hypothetical protein